MSVKHLLLRLTVLLLFTTTFIAGSLLMEHLISIQNNRKSNFPILLYVDSPREANPILMVSPLYPAYSHHFINPPDTLQNLLIENYALSDYSSLIQSFTLPYQIEIYVNPVPVQLIKHYIEDLQHKFKGIEIYYNENIWYEIDQYVRKLTLSLYAIQALALIAFIFLMLLIRHIHFNINKDKIHALTMSGIPLKKLKIKELNQNLLFMIFTILIIATIDFSINYLKVMTYLRADFVQTHTYINPYLCSMLLAANIIVLVTQKKIFVKKKYE